MNSSAADKVQASALSGSLPLSQSLRLESLDAFRGLVIATMTFVNYLAGIQEIWPWAKHAKPGTNSFTFVDVVFPAFLFIVGVAIPFAFHKRMHNGSSSSGLVGRILARAAALIFVGVITVNKANFLPTETGMSGELWFSLALLSVLVLWNRYGNDTTVLKRRMFLGLRMGFAVLLAYLLCIVRTKNAAGGVGWLQTQWWGILGLIGWAYLVSSLAYLACRGSSTALMGVLGGMILLYTGNVHGALDWMGPVHQWINVGAVFGTTAADVMIGILVGSCFVGPGAAETHNKRLRFMFCFGLGLLAMGYVVRPLHGIDKNAATEAYALITGGICCVLFAATYWVIDLLQFKRWAKLFIPVGQNALLAYLMPSLVANVLTLLGLKSLFYLYGSSWPGALNAAVLTLLILFITHRLTKRGILIRL